VYLSADGKFIPPSHISTFPVINRGVSESRTRSSRVKLSKASQEKLLDAAASKGTGMHVVENALDPFRGEW
jgi:hypothetical protein